MINRIEDQKIIKNIYAENLGRSSILILYARTGIGKSCLIDETFSEVASTAYIRVRINQREAEEIRALHFSSLAQALNTYAEETKMFYRINDFINHIYTIDNNTEKIFTDAAVSVLADWTKTRPLKTAIDTFQKQKKKIISSVLQNENEVNISVLLEYMVNISQYNNIIISIENIQLAENRFISFLKDLIVKTKKIFVIGEFTVKLSDSEVDIIAEQFDSDSIKFFGLDKIEKEELICAISQSQKDSNAVSDICKIIETSYDVSDGNLKNLAWLIKRTQQGRDSIPNFDLKRIKFDRALHSLYSSLINDQKLIIWYIVSHMGKLPLNIFNDFILSISEDSNKYFKSIEYLENLDILNLTYNNLGLIHDSAFELLKEEDDYLKYISIANHNWLNYYKKLTLKNDTLYYQKLGITRHDILITQLTLIINIGGDTNLDWMNSILSEISTTLGNAADHSLVAKITNIFYKIIENNSNKSLIYKTYEWVIIILSKLGFSQEIFNIYSRYKSQNASDLVFLLQSSARIAVCDATVNVELEKIDDQNNHFLYIGSQLLLIRYYRTFNQFKKSRAIWKKLLELKHPSPYQEVIYQQASICSYNIKKRITYLKLAKKGFNAKKNENNNYHLCSTILNINANLFYLYLFKLITRKRFLRIAEENLDTVSNILPKSHYPIHIYLNQKAVCEFVSERVSSRILMNSFYTAYLSCDIPGNKPLIGSNIVAVALKYKEFSGIQSYVNELMENSRLYSNLNSEFSKYPLINCYNYFYEIGDKIGQKEILYIFEKNNLLNNGMDYLIKYPFAQKIFFRGLRYYISNIINWDNDFEGIQKNYSQL